MTTPELDIARGVNAVDWHSLNLEDHESKDWDRAIEIFKIRITERYIEPAQILLALDEKNPPKERKYGFIVLAIDSMLIETLWAFKKGLADTRNKSKKAFKEFLTSEKVFDFTDGLAIQFYEDYRCGILHQAEIGSTSKVWSIGPLAHVVEDQLIINRTDFHKALVLCFEAYCKQLSDCNEIELREKFKAKMNHISRVDHYGE